MATNLERLQDGITISVAQDAQTSPNNLPPQVLSLTINRTLRGGRNKTRDSMVQIELKAASNQDPAILATFKDSPFQGAMAYKAMTSSGSDGFVVAAGGTIYFIAMGNGVGYLYKLIDGNDPTMMHTWFVQAMDWVYIQNNRQNAIAWNGALDGSVADLRAFGLGSPETEWQDVNNRERTSNIATLQTATPINLAVDDYVQVESVNKQDLNGLWKVTAVTSDSEFSYLSFGPNIGSAATGGRAKEYIGEIKITWSDNTTNEDHWQLEYFQGGNYTQVDIPANSTQYILSPAPPDIQYTFRIRAVYPDGTKSAWSNSVTTSSNNNTPTQELPPPISRLNPEKQEMPIGNIMAYAYGMVLVADEKNRIFVSDTIYGDGFTDTSNTRFFKNTTYWNEGGSFTPPANLGAITGMIVSPTININDRGQGEVVVGCQQGFFTINLSIDRTQWLDNNIQKTSLIGRGCMSPWSIILANNQIIFRAGDGWGFYNNSQVDFIQSPSFGNISEEVNPFVSADTPWMQQFASSMFFRNRLIATVSPFSVATADGKGMHRPNRAMIVLDLYKSSRTSPDAGLDLRWNGLWEGPQPTQLITANINRVDRGFCFSYDSDGVNRLYEMVDYGDMDMAEGESVPIKSRIITRSFIFNTSNEVNDFMVKQLSGGQVFLTDMTNKVKINAAYLPSDYSVFQDWVELDAGCDACLQEGEDCGFPSSNSRSSQPKFPSPKLQCAPGSNIPTNTSTDFQVKIDLEGSATIERFRVVANKLPIDDLTSDCNRKKIDCTPITGCPLNNFDFYRIIS